jgi:galactokinase
MPPGFEQLFGTTPLVQAEAPGRVNLMGDHTDYNGGFVLPVAIPRTTRVELARSGGRTVRVWSAAYPDNPPVAYQLGSEVRDGGWTDYVKGLTVVLAASGLRDGFDARIVSNVPLGSGLSSSAALEIALGRALRAAFGLPLADLDLALAARRAENEFVGAPVGIMDQIACSFASPSDAIFLDTRTLAFERVPLPPGAGLIVIDSGIEHRHAGGGYVQRRTECHEAARRLGVEELRDADEDALNRTTLPDTLHRRVRHVISENRRVHEIVTAFRCRDLARAGALFLESHASLRDDFEVSVSDIDRLVETAMRVRGVFGARLTGGGFGGSIVALAEADRARAAAHQIVAANGRVRAAVIVPA